MNPKILPTIFCGLVTAAQVHAQSISFNPFAAAPLSLNPAFTGQFDGKLRANLLYRRQWQSIAVPVASMAGSADMRIFSNRTSYWAAGLQIFRGVAGDGNLTNFQGFASLAFHQRFKHGIQLGVGVQGGYSQKTVDLSALYFDPSTVVVPTSVSYQLGYGNGVNEYVVHTGICFSHDVNEKLKYTIGVSANNINQPNDAVDKKMREDLGDDLYVNTTASVNWQITKRIGLRPSVLYQRGDGHNNTIWGSEFHYSISSKTNTVFAGLWYRSGDISSMAAGIEMRCIRASLSYDYSLSSLNTSSSGTGGIEAAIRYILPGK